MDCKHSFHSNKHIINKESSMTGHGRAKSKPKKLYQSHIINHGNNRLINHSPKTIDYSNAMKKFSNTKLSNPKGNHLQNKKEKQMKTIQTPMKDDLRDSFDQNAQGYSTLQYLSNPNEYDKCNLVVEEEEEKAEGRKSQTISLNNHNIQLKERVDYLEEELNQLKLANKGEFSTDKVSLFINLVRKYAKKLFALVNLDNQTNTEASQVSNELIMTIEQFSKTVFNKKVDQLVSAPLLSKALIDKDKDSDNKNGEDNKGTKDLKHYNTSRERDVELFISNYEENIAKYKKENDELLNLITQKEEKLLQAKNANSEEIVSLRRKLYDQMKHNDDIEKHLMCLKTVNRDIESKCMLLEEENNLYKRKMNKTDKKSYDANNNNHSMSKYMTEKHGSENRNDYIAYLESLLNKTNANNKHSASDKDAYLENDDKSKEKLSELINQSNTKKERKRESESKSYPLENEDKENERERNGKMAIKDYLKEDNNNNNNNNNNEYKALLTSERPLKIKKEIEEIDKEIFELQSQLRLMLDKK